MARLGYIVLGRTLDRVYARWSPPGRAQALQHGLVEPGQLLDLEMPVRIQIGSG